LAILAICAFYPVVAMAKDLPDPDALRPELPEMESCYLGEVQGAPGAIAVPAGVQDAEATIRTMAFQARVRSLPGIWVYKLDNPPRSHAWWNYVIYPVLGFPRDCFDGLFGVARIVPLINLMTTMPYEATGAQFLFRDPRDCHRWPGYRNHNGHGWIDNDGWGYFSNLHQTRFSWVDKARLEFRKSHNETAIRQIADYNKKIDAANDAANELRRKYIAEARRLFKNKRYEDVVNRMAGYFEIDSANREVRTMLAAALIIRLDDIDERAWAQSTLEELLRTSSPEMLIPIKRLLRQARTEMPERESIPFYLVGIDVRLREFGEAQADATRVAEIDPMSLTARRLALEAALASDTPVWVANAADELEKLAGAGAEVSRHARGRQAFVEGNPEKAQEIYLALAKEFPRNAKYHYLLGMSYVAEQQKGLEYRRYKALHALNRAIGRAQSPGEADRYKKAHRAADMLRTIKP
jgi:hypothetical protein